jgi:hypothetical protein
MAFFGKFEKNRLWWEERGFLVAADIKQFEMDRMVNMLRGYGWVVVRQETSGETIRITCEKVIKPEGK